MKKYLVATLWLLLSLSLSAQPLNYMTPGENSSINSYEVITPVSGIFMGYGPSYGGLGLSLLLKTGFFGFFIGVGYFPAFGFNPTDDADLDESLLASVGAKMYFYKSFYLNIQYGLFSYLYKSEKDYYSGSNFVWVQKEGSLYGPSIMVGGDFFLSHRWALNFGAGASVNMNSYFDEYSTWPAVDVGIIYRLF